MSTLNRNSLIDMAKDTQGVMASGKGSLEIQRQHNAFIWHLMIDHSVVKTGDLVSTTIQKQLSLFDVPLFDLLCCSQAKEAIRAGITRTVNAPGKGEGGIRYCDYNKAIDALGENTPVKELLDFAASLTMNAAITQDLRGLNRWITKGHGLLAYDVRGIGDVGKNTYPDYSQLFWSVDTRGAVHDVFMDQASVRQLQVMTDKQLLACCTHLDEKTRFDSWCMDADLKEIVGGKHISEGGR